MNQLTAFNHLNTKQMSGSRDLDKMKILREKSKNGSPEHSFKKMLNEKVNSDGSIKQSALKKRKKKLYKSCVEMESLLWKQVLNSMKKTINKYKLIDGGQAEEIFSDFLYDEYASMMAKNSNTKISDTMHKQLSNYM